MKTEILSGLGISTSDDWMSIPDLDFDASWLDYGDILEGRLEGIGEIVSGIFD